MLIRKCAAILTIFTLSWAVAAGAVAAPTPSPAESPHTPALQVQTLKEVVVTAEREKTNLQYTPVVISALSGKSLQNDNVNTLRGVSFLVPGFQFGQTVGQANASIRGIGSSDIIFGANPTIAYYQDGVYIAQPEAMLGMMFDVAQVQVLEGPQGTLYGRNATGGAIVVTSRKPTTTDQGYVGLTLGNYGTVESQLALSGPIAGSLLGRVAVQTLNNNGYGKNLVTGKRIDNANDQSVRASLLWNHGGAFQYLLQAYYHHENDRNYAEHYGGLGNLGNPPVTPLGVLLGGYTTPVDSQNTTNTIDPMNKRSVYSVTGTATWRLGRRVTLKSITGYLHDDLSLVSPVDPSSLTLLVADVNQAETQVSEELQSFVNIGRSHIIGGLYYFEEHLIGQEPVGINLLSVGGPNFLSQGVNQAGDTHTDSYAAYLQYKYDVTNKLSVTAGGRYTYEWDGILNEFGENFQQPFDPNAPITYVPPFPYRASKAYHDFTPTATISYKFNPATFAYVTFAEGFRAGGFNIGVDQPAFKPETIREYEGGLKTTLLGGKMRFNVSGFYYKYTNLQETIVNGTQSIIENAARATLYGGNVQLSVIPLRNLKFEGGVSALHSQFNEYTTADPANPQFGVQDLAGRQLPEAPKLTAVGQGEYTWPLGTGALSLRGQYRWTDTEYFTPFDTRNAWSPAHGVANAFLTFNSGSGNWRLTAFVRNLTNKTYVTDAYVSTALTGYAVNATIGLPRTYGVEAMYYFR